MKGTITRRKLASLVSRSLVAGSALALGNKIPVLSEIAAADEQPNHSASRSGGPVYIVLWFDVEDYILPASDDAVKRIADCLHKQGVRGTFKIVGEKARVLEARHRSDVIAAISRNEVGFHTNTHSQHPTVAEYESQLDWQQGAEEFARRERPGYDELIRIFGYAPTCYGQPGSSWAPQIFPTLKKWGTRIYLNKGRHIHFGGKPFWYGGLLNIFDITAGKELEQNQDWSNLESVKGKFKDLHAQLNSQPAGGLVSFMFHPTQLLSLQFWDEANFLHGANPPRSEWKPQPIRSAAQAEQAFQFFEGLISYIKSFPNVRFITATEAYTLYRDTAQYRTFEADDLMEIAKQVTAQTTFQVHDTYALSASEIFVLLNTFVSLSLNDRMSDPIILNDTPYGPFAPAYGVISDEVKGISWSQFSRTVRDVSDYLERNESIPSAVWFGSSAVTPEAYLLLLSSIVQGFIRKELPPNSVNVLPAVLAAGDWISKDSPSIWTWPIFPVGFHSQHLMDLARLQAWTLKPALLPEVASIY